MRRQSMLQHRQAFEYSKMLSAIVCSGFAKSVHNFRELLLFAISAVVGDPAIRQGLVDEMLAPHAIPSRCHP